VITGFGSSALRAWFVKIDSEDRHAGRFRPKHLSQFPSAIHRHWVLRNADGSADNG
jgi:hypothetical protein